MHLPIGVSNFRELITFTSPVSETGYLYVDKSLIIREILDDLTKVIIFTRPRRFGKTLTLSMLQHFFAADANGETTQGLFDGLEISKHSECMKHQGKYPVIFVSFKDVKETNHASAINGFADLMKDAYLQWSNVLLKSELITAEDKILIEETLSQNLSEDKLKRSLKNLVNMVATATGKKVYVLIDEYDTPLQEAYVHGYYSVLISFMRGFLGGTLKDNAYVKQAILTGILRISKESLFSDLNNIKVYSVLNNRYSNYFGFIEAEVNDLLAKANLTVVTQQTKEWYNGYNFGDTTVYNPWSIINFISENGKLMAYWINTSGNAIVKNLIINSDSNIKTSLQTLMAGGTIEEFVDEHIVFGDLTQNPDAAWSLLLMSGYLTIATYQLTASRYLCVLRIPNKEVACFYDSVVQSWLTGTRGFVWYRTFLDDLANGKAKEFEKKLQTLIEETLSCHDVTIKSQEAFYHGLMLAFVSGLKETHEIKSNKESGAGFYDVAIIPKDPQKPGIVMEFKATQDEDQLEIKAKEALAQIQNANYITELKQRGINNIISMGISFSRKAVKVLV